MSMRLDVGTALFPRGALTAGLAAALVLALALPQSASAQFGRSNQPRLELVERFDADGSGMLDAEERARALEFLASPAGPSGFGPSRGGGTRAGTPGEPISPDEVETFAGTPLYDTSHVRTIFVEFGIEDWESEMAAFYNTDVELPGRVIVDGQTYEEVGVRFRGNSSFRRAPAGGKRPIRLKFDRVHDDQSLAGYRTLNLLNAMNDPTFLRAVLYSHIARQYIPAPKVSFVRLVVNGENWGIFQNQQQFNRDFLADFFPRTDGVRWQVPGSPNGRGGMDYRGENIERYRGDYEIDNRDRPESWQALIELFRVLDETPLEELEAALDPIFDIDGALRFLALDVALVNSDGYWSRASDYYIFQDADGRFHVMPHDLNEGLGAARANTRLDPLVAMNDAAKPLRSRLLAVPELRERYLGYVRDIAENWLDWDGVLGPMAQAMHEMIDADVERDTRKLYGYDAFHSNFDGGASSLRGFVEQRQAYLLSVIDAR